MFTIEHGFDNTLITLVDDGHGEDHYREDVIIKLCDDKVVITQFDAKTGDKQQITLSLSQVEDFEAALDLPEGSYILRRGGRGD